MECPHCNLNGVPIWSKVMAGTASPVICKECGKASSMSGFVLGSIAVIVNFLFFGAVVAFFLVRHWWPFVVAFALFLLMEICTVRWAPLVALNDKKVKNNQIIFFIFLALLILLVIYSGISNG